MLTYATPKGNPHLIPTGAPPTFAADGSDISDWMQAGRSFRRAATQTALAGLTGMADRDLALVDAIPGAWFYYDGATAKWVMAGNPVFADAAARNAAITAPVTGMLSRVATERFVRRYSGSAWKPYGSGLFPIIPASVAGSGVTVGADGVVNLAAAAAASVNGVFTADFEDYAIHYSLDSVAGTDDPRLRLRAAGVDASASSDYGLQDIVASATTISTSSGASSQFTMGMGSYAAPSRHRFEATLRRPNLADYTTWRSIGQSFKTAVGMQNVEAAGYHAQATAFDGFTVKGVAGTGTFTGTLRIFGINNN